MSRTKTIEQKYQELSEVEHILQRPGMWVGSTKEEEKDMFIYDITSGKMEQQTIKYVPAMLKLVDEVISNSCDEFRRPDNMGLTTINVTIDKIKNYIEVEDNGGIPIVKHKEAGVYIPEFIFGRLRTSSNYDDSEDRNVVGTNGVGAGLTNCFSTSYKVISADGKNKLTCSWHDNMQSSNDTKIEKSKKHFTKTGFILDLKRFGVKKFSDDFINIIHKRCIDAAAANSGLKVIFKTNDFEEIWKFKSFDEYIDLYSNYIDMNDKVPYQNDLCTGYIFPGGSIDIGFVNGAECSKGTHMRVLRTEINYAVSEFLTKKDKMKDLSPRSIENKYSVFLNINVSNPAYSSQTKEELTTPVEYFSKDENIKWETQERFLSKICKSEIIELVRDWYKKKAAAEDERTLRKLNKEASKGLKRSDKYIPANSKKKQERELWIYEGDSAARGFRMGRNPLTQAAYLLRGVVPNSLDMTPLQMMKNDCFNDLISVLGLKFGEEFDVSQLNFGKIVISTDADTDGDRIAALLMLFFSNWPKLFENKIICRSITPIIICKKGKETKKYFSIKDFDTDAKKLKGYMIKYVKGLSGLDLPETKESMRNPIYMYFEYDKNAEIMFNKWFGKNSDIRKEMMEV